MHLLLQCRAIEKRRRDHIFGKQSILSYQNQVTYQVSLLVWDNKLFHCSINIASQPKYHGVTQQRSYKC